MLWNIENTANKTSSVNQKGSEKNISDVNQGTSSDNLDLVQILSHTEVGISQGGDSNSANFGSTKV